MIRENKAVLALGGTFLMNVNKYFRKLQYDLQVHMKQDGLEKRVSPSSHKMTPSKIPLSSRGNLIKQFVVYNHR